MTRHGIWISAAVLALCSVNVAQGQRSVVAPRVSPVRAHSAPPRLTLAPRASGKSAGTSSYGRSVISGSNLFGTGFGLFSALPGLGFNSGPDWAIKAAIDPATQWRLFETQRFVRSFGFGAPGFYLLDGGGYYYPAEPSEAQQAPPEQGAPAETETAVQEYAAQPAPVESAPLEDVGQFILALRNGTRVEAVAFTRAHDHIIYVTADGFRRSLALSDLDPDATIKINEERGTPLEIPL